MRKKGNFVLNIVLPRSTKISRLSAMMSTKLQEEEEEESIPLHYALNTDIFDGTYDPEEDEDFSSDETSSDCDHHEEVVSGDEDVIKEYA